MAEEDLASDGAPREVRADRPAAAGEGSARGPSDAFLRGAVERLGLLSLVFVGMLVVGSALNVALHHLTGWSAGAGGSAAAGSSAGRAGTDGLPSPLQSLALVALVLLSLGMYALTRARGLAPRLALDLGLVYEVLGAVLIVLGSLGEEGFFTPRSVRISWLCVWILLFPLVVPNTIRRNFAASLAAAAALPLVVAAMPLLGWSQPSAHGLWHAAIPCFVAAGVALVPAYLIHHLASETAIAEAEARRLGSYRLVELLGRGGMGEVWRAEHTMLARPAAIKLIHARRLEEDGPGRQAALQRFQREVQATAELRSPHTVSVYDFGLSQAGDFYYVMELLDGLDLGSLVERHGPVTPSRVIFLLRQACRSLAEAHAAGMIHRDIKPANLHVGRLGLEYDVVKVLDFGLVTRPPRLPEEAPLSQEGVILGTPAYMAPETIRQKPTPDHRVDIYALGCVAYWLLTGTHVFTHQGLGVLAAHLTEQPEPPSQRAGRGVTPALERLVMRCLAKSPDQRPPGAEALEQELAACAEEAGHWTQVEARKWWQRVAPDPSAAPTAAG